MSLGVTLFQRKDSMSRQLTILVAFAAASVSAQAQSCTRDSLQALIANYFKAVETHDMSVLPTAADLRVTENGQVMKAGEGFFLALAFPVKSGRAQPVFMTGVVF